MNIVCLLCSILLVILPYQSALRDSAGSHRTPDHATVPQDLAYAADFVRFLEGTGLVVQEVLRSHHEAMLGGNKAAFIRTNKGVVEVVFLPGETDAEKLTITYGRISSPAVPHRYIINGQAINRGSETWEAAYPQYVTLHKSWFITTSECELEGVIKRALRQDNHPDRR